jgi:hypothetical protein
MPDASADENQKYYLRYCENGNARPDVIFEEREGDKRTEGDINGECGESAAEPGDGPRSGRR